MNHHCNLQRKSWVYLMSIKASLVSVQCQIRLLGPQTPAQNKLAPPVSIASISVWLHGVLLNLIGSSLRSQNSPSFGCTEPNCRPDRPPIAPYGCAAPEVEGAWEEDACWPRLIGPCCWAFWRYEAKDSGREEEGEAGWTCGVWSISVRAVSGRYHWRRVCVGQDVRFGVVRLPMNLIIGWCCRRALVKRIFAGLAV